MDVATLSQRITECAREIASGSQHGTVNLEQIKCGLDGLNVLLAELGAPEAVDPQSVVEAAEEDEPAPAASGKGKRHR